MKIYLAGPLFTQAERRWNRELAAALVKLKPDLEIILPQDVESEFRDDRLDFNAIFRQNIESIEISDAIVAILDGSDSDSGTAWECGYAYAKGKPVISVRTDFRASEDGNLNAMLSQSSDIVFQKSLNEDIVELGKKIIERLERLEA
ncbi:MAG: nucleoside 2-deoxyribosyltransferase [Candidatus Dadabacteria bacterium]